ncbi:MAG: flagellar type III secretion system pore protein FliP [Lachnospiraceae bacterium]|nr:flagellar type III secretion system pore protein FliP [Lachnospiraceae bacterium]
MDKSFFIRKSKYLRFFAFLVVLLMLTFICAAPELAYATESESQGLDINASIGDLDISASTDDSADGLSSTLQILILLTVISLAPSILIMVTSFTRILIVLHFTRSATGMQTTPPNQVLIGLALFLTLFIMSPVFTEVNEQAIKPLTANEITQEEALDRGLAPLRNFMFKQIRNESDLTLFCNIAGIEEVETLDEIPTYVLIPAFIISELRIAFYIGFIIYIPFIVIDMVVSSTLMSMGMMMLPPTVISTPFKILLFIIVDGWSLIIGELVQTF